MCKQTETDVSNCIYGFTIESLLIFSPLYVMCSVGVYLEGTLAN